MWRMPAETIRFPHHLPYTAQIASLDLAEAVFSEQMDAFDDPNWRLSGAETREEYAHWVMRACGIVCVKMCAEGFGKTRRSVHEWIKRGLAHDAYLVLEENGNRVERGWIHAKMADLLREEGLFSQAVPAGSQEIIAWLRQGHLFIASVCYQLGTRGPVTFKGGHLVVVNGADVHNGQLETVYIHNPSGRFPDLRAYAAIPAERFLAAYTGRGVVSGTA